VLLRRRDTGAAWARSFEGRWERIEERSSSGSVVSCTAVVVAMVCLLACLLAAGRNGDPCWFYIPRASFGTGP
jgi:hypothetical protein